MSNDVFITPDFLLETDQARTLYHEYARDMPIIDYHCHLPAAQVAEDAHWDNISQIWLGGDHYKWRAMRANGVPERYCTGDADDREKFEHWAAIMPRLLRNPLYHWTHLELKQYFGISDRVLAPETAASIWDECNARIREPDFSCRQLMRQSNVQLVCTTDDPVDSLEHHRAVAADSAFEIQMLPTWRPDKGMQPEDPDAFNAWVDRLAAAADIEIGDFNAYLEALRRRHAFFHEQGCRLSDHGVETAYGEPCTEREAAAIFGKVRAGAAPDAVETARFKSAMLVAFGIMDAERDWTQQFHFGAMRNNNSRRFAELGPDTGFDCIGDFELARPLSQLLDRLCREDRLPRTILYNLNPRDNAMLVTLMGCFQDGETAGKMQFGSGWWFLDQMDGMTRQIEDLSLNGTLSRFVGMLTDSRSFLSYPRHEYFRRILCNILGGDMDRGLIPGDMDLVGGIVRDISYNNARDYFGFDL